MLLSFDQPNQRCFKAILSIETPSVETSTNLFVRWTLAGKKNAAERAWRCHGRVRLKPGDRARSLSRTHCKYVKQILVLHKTEATPPPPVPWLPVWDSTRVYPNQHARIEAERGPVAPRLHTNFFYGQLLKTLKSTKGATEGRRFGRLSAVGSRGPALTRRSLKEESVSPITS